MVRDRDMCTMEIVCGLSNDTITSDMQ